MKPQMIIKHFPQFSNVRSEGTQLSVLKPHSPAGFDIVGKEIRVYDDQENLVRVEKFDGHVRQLTFGQIERIFHKATCKTCEMIDFQHGGFGPSHNGSTCCQSGSIHSGGNKTHCTCDCCF